VTLEQKEDGTWADYGTHEEWLAQKDADTPYNRWLAGVIAQTRANREAREAREQQAQVNVVRQVTARAVARSTTGFALLPATIVGVYEDASAKVRIDGDGAVLKASVLPPHFAPPAGQRVMVARSGDVLYVVGVTPGDVAPDRVTGRATVTFAGLNYVEGSVAWGTPFEANPVIPAPGVEGALGGNFVVTLHDVAVAGFDFTVRTLDGGTHTGPVTVHWVAFAPGV